MTSARDLGLALVNFAAQGTWAAPMAETAAPAPAAAPPPPPPPPPAPPPARREPDPREAQLEEMRENLDSLGRRIALHARTADLARKVAALTSPEAEIERVLADIPDRSAQLRANSKSMRKALKKRGR